MFSSPIQGQSISPTPTATATAKAPVHMGAASKGSGRTAVLTVFFEIGSPAISLAGDNVNTDVAGPPHQIVHDRAVQNLEPARTRRFADDDVCDVVLVRKVNHVVGDRCALWPESVTASPSRRCASRKVSAMRSRSSSLNCRLRLVSR